MVNPQPGYRTNWNGWVPRVAGGVGGYKKMQAHAGGAVTVIPPNIWQDNFLTGSTPFVIYPRRVSSAAAPIAYGFTDHPVAAADERTRHRAQTFLRRARQPALRPTR